MTNSSNWPKANKNKLPQWRRDEIKNMVLSVLENVHIEALPVDLLPICNKYNISLMTLEKARRCGIEAEYKDGFTISKGHKHIIVYNHNIKYQRRVRWTIAHELGHVFLNHNAGCNHDPETEANYFALDLLMPLAVLDKLNARRPGRIAAICDVSYEAAEYRANDFARRDEYKARHGDTVHDLRFLRQFKKMFENEIAEELCPAA